MTLIEPNYEYSKQHNTDHYSNRIEILLVCIVSCLADLDDDTLTAGMRNYIKSWMVYPTLKQGGIWIAQSQIYK